MAMMDGAAIREKETLSPESQNEGASQIHPFSAGNGEK
jgi:hypothetical protein